MPGEPASLAQWETFYVIVGSCGGALTGLLFVVVALVADRVRTSVSQGLSAFSTPSVFHFVNVLVVAAVVTMPRKSLEKRRSRCAARPTPPCTSSER